MPINEHGFLGQDADVWAEQCEAAHKEFFQLCYDINRFAHKILFNLKIAVGEPQKTVSACLFVRVLEACQSAIHLVKRGLHTDASALIRVAFEALVILKNCSEDSEFTSKYLKTDEMKRLKIKRLAHKHPDNPYPQLRKAVTEKSITELAEKIKQENINKLNIEELSAKVGMTGRYDGIYRLSSDDVHTSPIVLTNFAEVNKEGDIVGFKYAPNDEDARDNLFTIADFMIIALNSILQLHKLDEKDNVNNLAERLLALYDKIKRPCE